MTTHDKDLLLALTGYYDAIVSAYELALREAPLRAGDQPLLARLRDDVVRSAQTVAAALRAKGGKPPPLPTSPVKPPELAGHPNRTAYLDYVIQAEELTAGAWYSALPGFSDRRVIAVATAAMTDVGRRLVELRRLAGLPLLPRAFETGSV